MDEILNKLLKSELLSEETKAQITKEWESSVAAFKTQVREEVSMEVRHELAEQWVSERDELVEKIDSLVTETLTKEIAELKGDVERFRDLEAEFAEKLVEEKHKLATEVAAELDTLVDKMDAFFEMRLAAEFQELREDLEVVRQNEFGRRMFEAFATEYAKHYVDDDSVQSQLSAAEQKLADAEARLAESEQTVAKMIREAKMEEVLSPLTGKKREQMAMILKNVDTSRLQESYKLFIGRILKESDEQPASLTEGTVAEGKTQVVTGDAPAAITEQKASQTTEVDRFKRLAGIK